MLHRREGLWNGLGGKFETGESPEDCIIREVLEESGLTIQHPKLCGFITFPGFKDDVDWYVFVYTATQFSGTLMDSPEGKLEWIEDSKITSLPLWEGDPIFLKWIEQGKFFSGKFVYKNKKLVSHEASFLS